MGFAPEYTASIDHWPEIEIDQLKDDLETALFEQDKAEEVARAARDRAVLNRNDYNKLKRTMKAKIAESNGELTNKSMIYLSLINEYENILGSIMEKYRVSLTTTTINSLRKRGGLIT
jgi:hypothetical protein